MNLFENECINNVFARYQNIKGVHKIVYQGKGVSLNDYYSAGHWSRRSKIKNTYKVIFNDLFTEANLSHMEKFSLVIRYNSRHDVDNVTGLEKVFIDTLREEWVKEDNKKYYRGYMVFPDEELPTNTFEFYLIEHA
jgi:hypothetical protein